MKLTHELTANAPRERAWALLMDVPAVAQLMPGVEGLTRESDDLYRGTMRVAVGPVRLGLAGNVRVVERDAGEGRALLRFDASDAKLGGQVRADVALSLHGTSPTRIVIASDVQILGRLGELGQSVIKRKADQIVAEFGRNLATALA